MSVQVMSNLQRQALILMQALLGVISPNFRMVWINVDDSVVVHVILEERSPEDEEEIENLMSEFEALQSENIEYSFETQVHDGEIDWPNLNSAIMVYKRREG